MLNGHWSMPLLQASAEPPRPRPLTVDELTTPARLALRVMGGAPRLTVPAALLSITHQVGEALVPVLAAVAIERGVSTGDARQLVLWLAVLAADFVMLSLSWRFGSRMAELGMLVVQHRLRHVLSARLLQRPARPGRASEQPGVALSLATSDANRLSEAVEIGVYPVGQLAAVLFGGAVLLTVAWPLGIAVLLGAPLMLWIAERAGRRLRERSSDEQRAAATAAGRATDLLAGHRVVRGIRAEEEAALRYRRASREALADTLRARRAEGILAGGTGAAGGLFLAAVAMAAGVLAVNGALGVGELIAVVGVTQFLLDPIQALALRTGSWWASATASAARLLEVLRDTEPGHSASPPTTAPEALSSLTTGELVVVDVDGEAATDLLRGLRAQHPEALIAPHAAQLFTGTVRENVALPGTTAGAVDSALRAAGCTELAEVLPAGFDSPVGESGTALSGGQRQRVALARALAQRAEVLILHEPMTAVDAVTEAEVAARVREERRSGRTIVLTRSPAFLAVADRVIRAPDAPPSCHVPKAAS